MSGQIASDIRDITVVKSGHVGGHVIKREIGAITTSDWRRILQNSVETLKHHCAKSGGNAIVNLHIEKDTHSESGSGDGTHYYSVFKASGKAVVIEKKKYHKIRKSSVAKDLERLSRLRHQGVLTENEFHLAKQKLLEG